MGRTAAADKGASATQVEDKMQKSVQFEGAAEQPKNASQQCVCTVEVVPATSVSIAEPPTTNAPPATTATEAAED